MHMLVQFVIQFFVTLVQIFLPFMNETFNRDVPDPPIIRDMD